MKVVNVKQAQEIAIKMLKETFQEKDNFPVIVEDQTIETSFGWVFFYNGKNYLETGNPMEMYIGNAPLIVDRNDGSTQFTGTAEDISYYIKEYSMKYSK